MIKRESTRSNNLFLKSGQTVTTQFELIEFLSSLTRNGKNNFSKFGMNFELLSFLMAE